MSKRERKPFVWRGWADMDWPHGKSYWPFWAKSFPRAVRVTVREVLPKCRHGNVEEWLLTGGYKLRLCRDCGAVKAPFWSRWRKPRRA